MEYNKLGGVNGIDFSLSMDLDCESVLQFEEITTIVVELNMNDNLVTKELNEDIEIDEDEIDIHSFYFIDCLKTNFVIKPLRR